MDKMEIAAAIGHIIIVIIIVIAFRFVAIKDENEITRLRSELDRIENEIIMLRGKIIILSSKLDRIRNENIEEHIRREEVAKAINKTGGVDFSPKLDKIITLYAKGDIDYDVAICY